MKLEEGRINEHLSRVGHWRREGDRISRTLQFADFQAAMQFVNRVAETAETLNHHPDILIHGWNRVDLTVTTHDEGGLTEKDFALAEKIETLLE